MGNMLTICQQQNRLLHVEKKLQVRHVNRSTVLSRRMTGVIIPATETTRTRNH